ncbi:GDP-mannose 4,6-dehydratase [Pseudomonas sp. 5P_3.1_Bac2]|uniref:GDP-mannose 4,6-dehydratase n=1 Tax=Pseudomonas sp. 5P_3.1_Bac2 TaxID=2971617 RepID=UPI0021C60DD2|nr:GDP-mannose 4,6-dehydratase [Pseudomonas sp. 5P_3.1_Bac2]MCU1719255.1 GDP-mannose 4,6-dehydratase [Pseudomonas sp. 5P_3.1_Bac2]
MKKLLVTGLNGFVGQHFQLSLDNHPDWQLLESSSFDLCQPKSLEALLAPTCPDAVVHLAGQTFVPEAFRNPAQTLQVNLIGTLNLLQALKARGFTGTFIYVSSGDVYGQVDESAMPISETQPARPRNPYAVSKIAAEMLCQQWSYVEPWRIVIARPFNHIGTGQSENFVISSIAKQLACISKGKHPPQIEVGDIDVSRDFLDVRDVISAYMCLLDKGVNGEVYNICSGQQQSIRDLIDAMIEYSGIQVSFRQDPSRMRKSEQRVVAGNPNKIKLVTGWQPSVALQQTMQAMFQEWLLKV